MPQEVAALPHAGEVEVLSSPTSAFLLDESRVQGEELDKSEDWVHSF